MAIKKEAMAGPARMQKSVDKAEKMFQKMIQQGKVTPGNIRKVKEKIAKKTGAYPMGGTE